MVEHLIVVSGLARVVVNEQDLHREKKSPIQQSPKKWIVEDLGTWRVMFPVRTRRRLEGQNVTKDCYFVAVVDWNVRLAERVKNHPSL